MTHDMDPTINANNAKRSYGFRSMLYEEEILGRNSKNIPIRPRNKPVRMDLLLKFSLQ
ncbi:MAG: hypothetical protein WDM78_17340 [Puia sp.]